MEPNAGTSQGATLPEPALGGSFDKMPPSPWKLETPLKTPLPKSAAPSQLEECHRLVAKYDDDMTRAWKDEIDKLLIFAGLFSAAVTAFVVESYQWLDTSPDPTLILLAQLISLQSNTTLISPVSLTSTAPSASAIRINIYWFLSLILSLTSVLVGIMCLQWLREYQQPIVASFQDKLTYRQVRYDGLIAWKIPEIITFLPVLLQIALLLFFVGVVDLLWERNQTVAAIVLIPISLVILFIIVTSFLPLSQAFRIRLDMWSIESMVQCPYKSPLSWLIYRSFIPILDMRWYVRSTIWPDYQKTSPQSFWLGFDRLWNFYNIGLVYASCIKWMKNEFKYDSAANLPICELLKAMPDKTAGMLYDSVRKELSGDILESFSQSHNDYSIIRKVACVLQLQLSPAHGSVFFEEVIRLAQKDFAYIHFLPSILSLECEISPELRLEFVEQVLMCLNKKLIMDAIRGITSLTNSPGILTHIRYLTAFSAPSTLGFDKLSQESPISHLLSSIFSLLTMRVQRASRDEVQKNGQLIWGHFQSCTPTDLPQQAQPRFAELIWTVAKQIQLSQMARLYTPKFGELIGKDKWNATSLSLPEQPGLNAQLGQGESKDDRAGEPSNTSNSGTSLDEEPQNGEHQHPRTALKLADTDEP